MGLSAGRAICDTRAALLQLCQNTNKFKVQSYRVEILQQPNRTVVSMLAGKSEVRFPVRETF